MLQIAVFALSWIFLRWRNCERLRVFDGDVEGSVEAEVMHALGEVIKGNGLNRFSAEQTQRMSFAKIRQHTDAKAIFSFVADTIFPENHGSVVAITHSNKVEVLQWKENRLIPLKQSPPLSHRVLSGHWLSLVGEDGITIFSVCLPEAMNREAAFQFATCLNLSYDTKAFKIELSGMPQIKCKKITIPPWIKGLFLQLGGIAFVSVAFAYHGMECRGGQCPSVGGQSEMNLWFAIGATLPWLSYLACTPVAIALGHDIFRHGFSVTTKCLLNQIPMSGVSGLVATGLLGWIVGGSLHWSNEFIASFIVGVGLHLLLALLMIFVFTLQRSGLYLLIWASYAAALIIFPRDWAAPPMAAIFILLIAMTKNYLASQKQLAFAVANSTWRASQKGRGSGFSGGLFRGLILGTLLWGDKIVILARFPEMAIGGENAAQYFTATLPGLFLCNYFFLKSSPALSRAWTITNDCMFRSSIPVFNASKKILPLYLKRTLGELLLVFQVGCIVTSFIFFIMFPGEIAAYRAMMFSSATTSLAFVAAYGLVLFDADWSARAFGVLQIVAFSGFLIFDQQSISFETFNLVVLLMSATGSFWLACVGFRIASFPEYFSFWRKVASW